MPLVGAKNLGPSRYDEQVRQVAPSEATVLVRGSSGTGKELVARGQLLERGFLISEFFISTFST